MQKDELKCEEHIQKQVQKKHLLSPLDNTFRVLSRVVIHYLCQTVIRL